MDTLIYILLAVSIGLSIYVILLSDCFVTLPLFFCLLTCLPPFYGFIIQHLLNVVKHFIYVFLNIFSVLLDLI